MKFDAIIIGGGLAGCTAAEALSQKGLRCAVVSEGHSLRDCNPASVQSAGGSLFAGDRAVSARIEGDKVAAVFTEKMEDEPLEADWYVLATGKYFSKGLAVDMKRIYEPVFGLDIDAAEERSEWFDADFSAPQKFMEFGVRDCGSGKVSIGGKVLANVFAAGEVLAGITDIEPDAEEIIRKSALAAVSNITR